MTRTRLISAAALAAAAGTVLFAQGRGGGAEWLTANGDAQRTSWIRTDAAISVNAFAKPGFDLQWKTKLAADPRAFGTLAQGVAANGVTLFTPLSIITSSANDVFALDNDSGHVFWHRHFELPAATCSGGMTSAATKIVEVAPPALQPARTGGAGAAGARGGGGYRGVTGEPGAGAPIESRGGAPAPAGAARGGGAPPPAAAGARGGAAPPAGAAAGAAGAGRGAAGGGAGAGRGAAGSGIPGAPANLAGGGFGRPSGVAYAVTSDGTLHVLGLPSGKDIQQPAPFLPAGSKSSDVIAVNDTLYGGTSRNCGGADGVYGIDLASSTKPVTSWKTNGGGVVGPVSFATDGTVLVSIGPGQVSAGGYANAVIALDPKTLQVKDSFSAGSSEIVTAPVIFKQGDKDVVAVATKDGRVLLLDAGSLGGSNHTTPLFASQPLASGGNFAPGGLALWQQLPAMAADAPSTAPLPAPTTWLLVAIAGTPTSAAGSTSARVTGAVAALKVTAQGNALSLTPSWMSPSVSGPVTPIVINDVTFVLGSGGSATGPGAPAVLYALDGSTGKELWTSGKTISAPLSGSSFWAGNGQVYVGTTAGDIYAFGFAMERH